MSTELLELTGMTQDELADRIVENVTKRLLWDRDEEDRTRFYDELQKQVVNSVAITIKSIADEHVVPRVDELIKNTKLRAHNKWGEAKGEEQTFTEYLVARADVYFGEKVNHRGETKEEARQSYDWKATTTRAVHLVNRHLQDSIKVAMDQILKDAGKLLEGGIEAGLMTALDDVQERLKVQVNTK